MATDYILVIQTIDKKNVGPDANVIIVLHGEDGTKTKKLTIDKCLRSNTGRGMKETFSISTDTHIGKIESIEMWIDSPKHDTSWFVSTVEVSYCKSGTAFLFPFLRWIHPDKKYRIRYLDTSLPMDDPFHNQRSKELDEKRKQYQILCTQLGIMSLAGDLQEDEIVSFNDQFDVKCQIETMKAEVEEKLFTKGEKWKSLKELTEVLIEAFGEPYGVERWNDDFYFGWQRMNGPNPCLIELCQNIPENFAVNDEMLKPVIEGLTIKEAIAARRLFIINLKILTDLPRKCDDGILPAPMALFFLDNTRKLLPKAIQLFQQKSNENPVFLPTDPTYTWMMAKMWYNLAESTHHQVVSHLGFTHFCMESICLSMHRNLSPSHPLFKLLQPHFLHILPLNTLGFKPLFVSGGWFDTDYNIGFPGTCELLKRGKRTWRLDVHGTLTKDLIERGLDDPDTLPEYYFRFDAILLYDAIKKYVTDYVVVYYDSIEKISSDWELQGFGEEMAMSLDKGGCGILGIPYNGIFTCFEYLITVLTSIIFTCNVTHAAVNSPQYEEYGFSPNYTFKLHGSPPPNKTPLAETDIVKSLPDKATTLNIMATTKLLSDPETNCIGDFEIPYIYDPPAVEVVQRFRHDLTKISRIIKERNKLRKPAYQWLDPENVPNAIHI